MAEASAYLRVIGSTVLQGLSTGGWVAAGELPAGKRRALRAGIAVASTAVGWVTVPEDERPDFKKITNPDPDAEPDRPRAERRMTASLAATGLAVGVYLGGRMLEKRWLTGLQRGGHPHPYRALGLRIGVLTAASALPARLLEVRRKG
jgi:hypothetical protein